MRGLVLLLASLLALAPTATAQGSAGPTGECDNGTTYDLLGLRVGLFYEVYCWYWSCDPSGDCHTDTCVLWDPDGCYLDPGIHAVHVGALASLLFARLAGAFPPAGG